MSKDRWIGDYGAIHVWFYGDKAGLKYFYPVSGPKQTPLEHMYRRMKGEWHRWFP